MSTTMTNTVDAALGTNARANELEAAKTGALRAEYVRLIRDRSGSDAAADRLLEVAGALGIAKDQRDLDTAAAIAVEQAEATITPKKRLAELAAEIERAKNNHEAVKVECQARLKGSAAALGAALTAQDKAEGENSAATDTIWRQKKGRSMAFPAEQ
jgi:hypothetical protein